MKKIFVVILIALIIINVIVGAFLFIDIQILKAPEIKVDIEPIELTADSIIVEARATITNPNQFDISVENFNVISTTKDGFEIGRFFIEGGTVLPQKSKTFTAQDRLAFAEHDFNTIENKVTGNIGINVFGIIKKTIPFIMMVDASLANITNKIAVPIINLQVSLDNLTVDGILFSGTVNAYNPSDFEMFLTNISVSMKTEKNVDVGNLAVNGGILEPAGSLTLKLNGTLLFKALDAQNIYVNLSGNAGIKAAGANKSLPFFVEINVAIPNLETLLDLNGSIDFLVSGDFKLRLQGVLCLVEFAIYNPSNIPLDFRNVECNIYRLDNNNTQSLGTKGMTSCIVQPKSQECLTNQIIIPYRKFLFSGTGKILPDWFILTIIGDISISGVQQKIPVAIIGYLTPHFFRNTAPMPTFPFFINP